MTQKFCKDCKHCAYDGETPNAALCMHPRVVRPEQKYISLVSGEETTIPLETKKCETMRSWRGKDNCGPEGDLWEAKA